MVLKKQDYLRLVNEYLFLKKGRLNFEKNPYDSNFRKNLGSIVTGNPYAFAGMPADKVDGFLNSGLESRSRKLVKETKKNLDDIVNDIILNTKDEELIQLALAVGPYAKDPKYKSASRLHKQIEEGQEALQSQDYSYMAQSLVRIYRDLAGAISYASVGIGRENIAQIYNGILQMKAREFNSIFSSKIMKKNKKGEEIETSSVDRNKISSYILDSAKNIKKSDSLQRYEFISMLYQKYNSKKP